MSLKKLNTGFFISWSAVLFFLFIIYMFSNENGEKSSSHSNGIAHIIFKFLGIDFSVNAAFILRKLAHFSEYAFLGAAFYNAFLRTFENENKKISIFSVGLCASLDEIHQYFIQSRTAAVEDIAIDLLGGIFGIFILCFMIKRINKCRKKIK